MKRSDVHHVGPAQGRRDHPRSRLLVLGVAIYKLGAGGQPVRQALRARSRYLPNANGLREGGTVMVAGPARRHGQGDRVPARRRRHDAEPPRRRWRSTRRCRAGARGLARASCARSACSATRSSTSRPARRATRSLRPATRSPGGAGARLRGRARAGERRGERTWCSSRATCEASPAASARGEGTVGQLLTNRALYDELNGTLARTNALVTRLQAPNGSFGKLLDDPALYQNLNGMIGVGRLAGAPDAIARAARSASCSPTTRCTRTSSASRRGADSLVKAVDARERPRREAAQRSDSSTSSSRKRSRT